jgi:hypothetical protein
MGFDTEIECTDRNGTQSQSKYFMDESEENGKVKWIFNVISFSKFYEKPYSTSDGKED